MRKEVMNMKDPGLLIVVSGPSGAGKGTICDALRKRFPNINYSISMTTRSPRPGEQDGINYFFSDNAHFEELLAQDAFLEHAKVYDHYYGTPKDYVFRMLNEGKHVMLEIDIQGAINTTEEYLDRKLTPYGVGYIGASDAVGIVGGLGSAWSFGTSIGKWIVESNWYFKLVHNNRTW